MTDRPTQSAPAQAIVGTIIFALIVPGSVILYVPYALTRFRFAPAWLGLDATRWMGVALFVIALPIFFGFLVRFVREGHGTPAPIAPTRRLVIGGMFRHVRNPGYVSVIALLLGETLFLGSRVLLLYTISVALAFHLFVIFYEEPALRRSFGAEYEAYCRRVPRWIPRLRAPSH